MLDIPIHYSPVLCDSACLCRSSLGQNPNGKIITLVELEKKTEAMEIIIISKLVIQATYQFVNNKISKWW